MKKSLTNITKAIINDTSGERLEIRFVEEMDQMRSSLKWVSGGFACPLLMGLLYVGLMT